MMEMKHTICDLCFSTSMGWWATEMKHPVTLIESEALSVFKHCGNIWSNVRYKHLNKELLHIIFCKPKEWCSLCSLGEYKSFPWTFIEQNGMIPNWSLLKSCFCIFYGNGSDLDVRMGKEPSVQAERSFSRTTGLILTFPADSTLSFN